MTVLKNNYTATAKWLHWITAVLVIGLLLLGFYMTGLKFGPEKLQFYGWHKATGALVLALTLVRLLWRCHAKPPALPLSMELIERYAAHGGHYLLYGMLFLMPLSGWLMSSAAGFPVSFFGWFELPNLIAPDSEKVTLLKTVHFYSAWLLVSVITLHVLAALWHHLYKKDTILKRMLP